MNATATTPEQGKLKRHAADAIRFLAMDAVEKANSGHPGMPMGMADIAEVLWNEYLSHNPTNPKWANRDRFVVSNGHGSMLVYALLHLSGYGLPIDELKNFRQLHSKTPGHPENGLTVGIETTTGPLGQGISNAVGMALAERLLAAEFNRDGFPVVDHHTYVFLGDGCLMEGVSHESCALAGTFGLGKLVAFYDDNNISIDGDVRGWFRDDTPGRFEAYGWQVVRNVNGHDADEVRKAIETARSQSERPTLICCKTVIGFGSPNKQGTAKAHGAALGADEIKLVREKLGWPYPPFEIPQDIYKVWDARDRGARKQGEWQKLFDEYSKSHPVLAAEFERRMAGKLPADWSDLAKKSVDALRAKDKPLATRKSSEAMLNEMAPGIPELFGGSADLTESNNTIWHGAEVVTPDKVAGRYLSYGVREFGMAAVMNGVALHGGLIPFGGTFAVFSDYARNGIRMSALMKQRVIYVLTHDSVGLGEDGPTHQPVEHAPSLRLIPNLDVWRPCDNVETAVTWREAVERTDGPCAMLLSRQNLPQMPRDAGTEAAIARGGYVLADSDGAPALVLIATGSEVHLAVEAKKQLDDAGIPTRVVSMPSTNVFDRQDAAWKASVLPAGVPRVAVEASQPDLWHKYVGLDGGVVGISTFGESAPGPKVFEHFGITTAHVVEVARKVAESAAAEPAGAMN